MSASDKNSSMSRVWLVPICVVFGGVLLSWTYKRDMYSQMRDAILVPLQADLSQVSNIYNLETTVEFPEAKGIESFVLNPEDDHEAYGGSSSGRLVRIAYDEMGVSGYAVSDTLDIDAELDDFHFSMRVSNATSHSRKRKTLESAGLPDCNIEENEVVCNRALGMAFKNDGSVLWACTPGGLVEVTAPYRHRRVVASSYTDNEGKEHPIVFCNSVTYSNKTGKVYFTTSSVYPKVQYIRAVLSNQKGALLAYDPMTDTTKMIMEASFPNGVKVVPEEFYDSNGTRCAGRLLNDTEHDSENRDCLFLTSTKTGRVDIICVAMNEIVARNVFAFTPFYGDNLTFMRWNNGTLRLLVTGATERSLLMDFALDVKLFEPFRRVIGLLFPQLVEGTIKRKHLYTSIIGEHGKTHAVVKTSLSFPAVASELFVFMNTCFIGFADHRAPLVAVRDCKQQLELM